MIQYVIGIQSWHDKLYKGCSCEPLDSFGCWLSEQIAQSLWDYPEFAWDIEHLEYKVDEIFNDNDWSDIAYGV